MVDGVELLCQVAFNTTQNQNNLYYVHGCA